MKIGDRIIGGGEPPYIIAEAANNFNNDFSMAKEMVIRAKEAGADAIKFQLRYRPDRLTEDQHIYLKGYCSAVGITYLCTAFDMQGLVTLCDWHVPAFKIGSAETVNRDFVSAVFSRAGGRPVLVSTGACTQEQIDRVWLTRINCVLMQCTSIYPTPPNRMHLGVLSAWLEAGATVGLSSHCPHIAPSLAAVALGASVIEHHVTLDPGMPGPDQSSSLTFDQLEGLVMNAWAVWEACQGDEKVVYPEELEKMRSFRK